VRYRLIAEAKAHHAVSRLARVLGVSRSGYCAWRSRRPSARSLADAALRERIEAIHEDSRGIYGAPRIHAELAQAHGIRVGRKRVARLMREAGLAGVSRRRSKRTTVPAREAPAAPDLVRRNFSASAPDELWLADITYVPTWEGFLFVATVMDACSRRIVGWSMRDDLHADLVVDALGMAVTRRRPAAGLVHHSDRGSQYTSLAFGATLRESGIAASMGSRGDAYDNAAAESCIATIKTELVNRCRFKNRNEARLAIFDYIECFYNPVRRHSALGYRSPVEFEEAMAEEESEKARIGKPERVH
jgi:putative transposase